MSTLASPGKISADAHGSSNLSKLKRWIDKNPAKTYECRWIPYPERFP